MGGDSVDATGRRMLPALRPVEILIFEQDGEKLALINDRQGVAEEPIVLRAAILPFLSFLDGEHTLIDLQAAMSRAAGRIVAAAEIETFVEQLDRALVLESERFRAERSRIVGALRAASERLPTHADRVYPAAPDALRSYLDGLRAEHAEDAAGAGRARVAALVAPHIDYERGARCYARTYRRLGPATGRATAPTGGSSAASAPSPAADTDAEPDVYVLVGTAHGGLESYYSVLPKPFATPLGRLPLDLEVVGVLERQLGAPTDHDLLVHRTEHSLELTATYLAYALDGQVRPIVPVLCGVGAAELRDGGDTVRAAITEFVESLQTTLGRLGRRACFVAGADLAHVGPRFGDSQPVTDAQLEEVEAADRRALAAAADGDAERFAAAVLEVDERHRVCGLGAIYTVLRLLETGGGAGCGELVDYGQARDADGSQCVSFAGMCFARG